MRVRLAIWFLLLSGVIALGMGNNGVPPFFGNGIVDTWNPNDKSASAVLSGGNLTWSNGLTSNTGVRSIVGKSNGLLYHEYKILSSGGGRNDCANGIAASSFVFTDGNANNAFVSAWN